MIASHAHNPIVYYKNIMESECTIIISLKYGNLFFRSNYLIVFRHTVPEIRPAFPHILLELMHPDFKLLKWTAEDVSAYSEQARTLGAPLEAGEELFVDLQKFYT